MKVGDIVVNEYNHTGKLLSIAPPDEALVVVYNYGISGDADWCSLSLCRLATEAEIVAAFEK